MQASFQELANGLIDLLETAATWLSPFLVAVVMPRFAAAICSPQPMLSRSARPLSRLTVDRQTQRIDLVGASPGPVETRDA
jgi:hypothetical protein